MGLDFCGVELWWGFVVVGLNSWLGLILVGLAVGVVVCLLGWIVVGLSDGWVYFCGVDCLWG